MDILTLIGIILGGMAVIGGQLLDGGNIKSILQPTAAIIVFGGTCGAVFIQYPFSTVLASVKLATSSLLSSKEDLRSIITEIAGFARHAHRNGLLSLEDKAGQLKDPFFRKGMNLVVDGTTPEELKGIMDIEMEYEEERKNHAARVFESAGGYAPTLGILGAVLGLIQVMENLAEPSRLGEGISVAFVATVYGVASANLFWLPFSGKIKNRTRDDSVRKELVLEGLMALSSGESPKLIEERLEGFLEKKTTKEDK